MENSQKHVNEKNRNFSKTPNVTVQTKFKLKDNWLKWTQVETCTFKNKAPLQLNCIEFCKYLTDKYKEILFWQVIFGKQSECVDII